MYLIEKLIACASTHSHTLTNQKKPNKKKKKPYKLNGKVQCVVYIVDGIRLISYRFHAFCVCTFSHSSFIERYILHMVCSCTASVSVSDMKAPSMV